MIIHIKYTKKILNKFFLFYFYIIIYIEILNKNE